MSCGSHPQGKSPLRISVRRFRTEHALRCWNGLSLLILGAVLSCYRANDTDETLRHNVEFGVFFGAQIQQRIDIPFQLDETRQQQGFRIKCATKTTHPVRIEWELDYPTKRKGPSGPGNAPRALRFGVAVLPQGADRFEQRVTFLPTDQIGTWNIRVRANGEVLLDRPFRVVATTTSDIH